ncbi:RNA-directed DNA polymerase, eukaryota [Tanacetum coccineum]|uniref:phosphoglycerate kinase n=1 Tax=Tanacetum coccineum TaxID=301880 RepID=A0ABQ5GB48_9ASTR
MRVFARVDLNEPLDDSFKITDDTCIRAAVPTIKSQQGQRLFSVDDFQWDYVWFTLRMCYCLGIEEQQLEHLVALLDSVILSNSNDRWVSDLNGDGVFRVKDVRNLLDEFFLPRADIPTRWVKNIPIKVNIFAWKLALDRLPTRANLVQRNVVTESQSCPLCDAILEDTSHLFFNCSLARDVTRLLCRWWNLGVQSFSSYAEWLVWFNSVRLASNLKVILEGVFYVTWWSLWNFRNQLLFASKKPRKESIFDDIVLRSFCWCKAREMVESFCNSYYIPDEVHPTAPGRDRTITQFPEGKVGVYTRLFDYCGYRIPLTKFFVAVLKYFRIHISQLSPFGAARISHFEVLTRVLDLGPSVAVFRAFYTRIYSDGLFSFAKRSLSAPSCLSKPPDSIKNWADHFFWVDSRVFLISVPLYSRVVPHLTAHQEQAVQGGPPKMGLLDYIRTAAPEGASASGSGSGAGPEVSAPSAGENVVAEENVIPVGTYVDLVDPEGDLTVVEKGDVAQKQPEKGKRKKLSKQSEPLPAKRLRIKGLPFMPGLLQWTVHTQVTVRSSRVADAPVYTAADTVTSSRGKTLVVPTSDVGGSSQPETSEESADSFYETAVLNSEDAKRWYIPRWNITNDSLLDDGFSCRTLVDRICLGSEVRSRTEHELELKEKLRVKYDARGVLLGEKDAEIARLKSLVKEKETESAEVLRLRDQVSVLAADKSFLSAEVSALKSAVSQKDTDISLLDSRASYLKSALDDSQAACDEARNLISSLSSERDGLASEKMEAQQEAQAQELYNRVAELEAHVMDVSGRLEGEFYPAYLTALAGRRWLLTHGIELAMVKCLKSPEYQGILGHALGRAVDYGMQEGLAAGHEHGVAGTPLSSVVAYNPETAESNYLDAVRALEEADFPLVHLLKSKKDSGMDEVLDCFLLDGPLADLPEAAHLQPCLEQLSVPIYHADVNAVVGETSLSFALLNVHTRAEGAKRHASALRQLMVDIVSHPLSSQNLLGEASTSAVAPCVEDLDTDEDLGSVVCMPKFEDPRFEILP